MLACWELVLAGPKPRSGKLALRVQQRCHASTMQRCEMANLRDEPADSSFRVALRETTILATRIKQDAHRRGLDTPRAVEVSNLKGGPPLLEEHTVGVEQTEIGIVNVRCLGSDSVELYNLHVPARHEVLPRRNTNVKTPEEETVEGSGDTVDDFFQGWRNGIASVKKDRPSAMGPNLDQLNSFPGRRDLLNPLCILAQIKV